MNGRIGLPIKAWRAERDKLIVEKRQLNREYDLLKIEVREAEIIRRNVHDIMRTEAGREQPKRGRDKEL